MALIGYSSIGASKKFLGEINMNKLVLAAAVVAAGFSGSSVFAEGKSIGVSWASFQEERWKIDEAAMVAAIEAEGNTY